MSEKIVHKAVSDLGAAAYVMMHKYKVVGKKGKSIYFEIGDDEVSDFEDMLLEYLSSEYHRFDSCLMSLKKISEYFPKDI